MLRLLILTARALVLPKARLAAENLALRQQLALLVAKGSRPRLVARDRLFWVLLRRVWSG